MKIRREVLIPTICLCLAMAAFASRLYRLDEIPPGLFFDEGAHGVDALQVLQGNHTPYFPDNGGREALIVYAVALAHKLLGTSILAIRLPTALASAGAVLTLFYAGYIFFGIDQRTKTAQTWRGVFIGGVSAALLAVSLNHLVLGRLAFRSNFLIFLLSLSLGLLWQGWHQNCWRKIALSGLCAGILQYTYIPARLHPVLLLLFGLSLLVPPSSNSTRKTREACIRAVPFAAVFTPVVAPLLIYFIAHMDHMTSRIGDLSILASENPLRSLLLNTWDHILVFGFRGDPNWSHTYASLPMLNPWEALFFWLGLALALWRWRTHMATRLLAIWVAVMLIPAVFSYDVPRNTLRMIGAAPAVYLLIGCALWDTLEVIKRKVPVAAPVFASVIVALIVAQGASSYLTYFSKYDSFARSQEDFHGQWTEAAMDLNDLPASDGKAYVIFTENQHAHYGFDYIYDGGVPAYIMHSRGSGMSYEPGTSRQYLFRLSSDENLSAIDMVDWDERLGWNDDEEQEVFFLLKRYGRYAGSQKFDNFQIHKFENLSLQLPWRFWERMDQLAVSYDAGINLVGIAVGQDANQFLLATPQNLVLDQNQPLWVGMRWQIEHRDFDSHVPSSTEADYKISLRLYNAAGDFLYSKDSLLENMDSDTTTSLMPGQTVDTLFFMDIPSDFPPGSYELHMVVYNADTLLPTVQIGTWKPEIVLANFVVLSQ